MAIRSYYVLLLLLAGLIERSFTRVAVFYEDVRREFTHPLARTYCTAESPINETDYAQCLSLVNDQIRSLKLAEFYNRKKDLEERILSFYNVHRAQSLQLDPLRLFLRHKDIVFFHEKLQILQDLADDPQVQKICIVGANLGYSTLNFLVSNPSASVIIFDNFDNNILASHSSPEADSATLNIHSKVALQMIIELYPERSIIVVSGKSLHSLSSFNHEFPDKMDCNLLFLDGQTQQNSFLEDLRQSLQLLHPKYNRFVIESPQLSNIRSLFSYYSAKINEDVECPLKLASRSKRSCLQKNVQSLHNAQQKVGDTLSLTNSCEKRCQGIHVDILQKFEGFALTPCVAMYANTTDGLHIEFIFNYSDCQLEINLTDHPHYMFLDPNGKGKRLLVDSSSEIIVGELKYDF